MNDKTYNAIDLFTRSDCQIVEFQTSRTTELRNTSQGADKQPSGWFYKAVADISVFLAQL